MLRAARVGDGLPRRRDPAPDPAAPRTGGHRCGRRVTPDPLLPLRRLPVLHAVRRAAEPTATDPGNPTPARAAGLPARRHGPLQVGLQAQPRDPRGARGGLLRAGRGDPRAGHEGIPVRPAGARLRAGRDRDNRGQGGVRRRPAALRRARRCPPWPVARRLRRPARRSTYGRRVTSTRTGRWVRLDGTTNTRDLGGLPTTDGGITVPRRVLRSDNLQTLSEDDVRRLVDKIGLREVIDLRTTAEILLEGRGPLREVAEVSHRHFS